MTSFTLKLSSSTSWPTYWYSARHLGPCARGWGLGRPTPGTGRCPTLRFLCMPATPWSGTLRNSVLCSEGGRARGRLLAPKAEDGGPRGGLWEPPADVISRGRWLPLAEGGTPLRSRPLGGPGAARVGAWANLRGFPWAIPFRVGLELLGSPSPTLTVRARPLALSNATSPEPREKVTLRVPPPPQPSFFTRNCSVSLKVRGRGLRTASSKRLHRRLTNSVLKTLSRKLSAASSWRMKKSSCRVLGRGGRKGR